MSKPGSIRSGKLAGKSMRAAIWILAAPILLQQTMHACVGLFDKIIAGSLPQDIVVAAMDGLGIGSYVGWLIGIAMTGLGIGGQALIARSIGGGQTDQAERALGQAIGLSVVWGSLVGVALWFAAPLIGIACQLSDEAMVYFLQYVRCLSVSMPFFGVMTVGSMCLHGGGETTWPSGIAIVVSLVNIPLSWLFSGAAITLGDSVFVSPWAIDLHVLGIALGTALSYVLGAALILGRLLRGVKDLALRPANLRSDRGLMWRIVRVGVPNFFEGIAMWAVNLLVLMIIGLIATRRTDGEGLLGANIIATQWEAFSFLPGFAIGTAAGALAGQYLGANNPAAAKRAVLVCTAVAMVVMGIQGIVFIVAGRWLTALVSREPIHLEEVPPLLFVCGLIQIFFAIAMVIRQGLRGVGDTRWVLLITTFSSYAIRLPAAWILGVTLEMGLYGVWIALCGELVIRAMLFAARFFHGGWQHVRV